jgi:DUF1009 family protein
MSQFVPKNFDSKGVLVLIAGKGSYPLILAKKAVASGVSVRLIELRGETSEELVNQFSLENRASVKVGQVGKLIKELIKFRANYAVMAGQVTPGKLFRGMHPDLKAIRMLSKLKRKNAETIFGAIGDEIENAGVHLLDARVFMDDELATLGVMVKGKEKIQTEFSLHGIEIAQENARLDVGQGVVVSQGTVLAVEAFEGTNSMLLRAGSFRAKNCLFIKVSKPNQDNRFDVPVFGLKTLDSLKDAGIGNAILESGSVIMLEKDTVLKKAKKLGIGISGF